MIEDILKDRAGGNPTTQHYGTEYIRNIKNNNNMIDIWWEKNPNKREYTYFNDLAEFKSRIDRFYLSSGIEINFKIRAPLTQNYLSDHRMISISIQSKKKTERKEFIILEIKFQYPGEQRLYK